MHSILVLLFDGNQEKKDGLEVISTGVFAIAALSLLGGCPLIFIAVEYNLPVFRLVNSGNTYINILIVILVIFMYIGDWAVVLNVGMIILVHMNFTNLCLRELLQAW
jgi:hypothetical protein